VHLRRCGITLKLKPVFYQSVVYIEDRCIGISLCVCASCNIVTVHYEEILFSFKHLMLFRQDGK